MGCWKLPFPIPIFFVNKSSNLPPFGCCCHSSSLVIVRCRQFLFFLPFYLLYFPFRLQLRASQPNLWQRSSLVNHQSHPVKAATLPVVSIGSGAETVSPFLFWTYVFTQPSWSAFAQNVEIPVLTLIREHNGYSSIPADRSGNLI